MVRMLALGMAQETGWRSGPRWGKGSQPPEVGGNWCSGNGMKDSMAGTQGPKRTGTQGAARSRQGHLR